MPFSVPGRCRTLLRVGGRWLVLLGSVGPVAAQHTPPGTGRLTPIAEVLVDANGDRVPDRAGQPVSVAGRASVSSDVLRRSWIEFYVEDGTGGLKVLAPAGALPIAAGDSVIASGRLEFNRGMARLADPVYYLAGSDRREPEPIRLDVTQEAMEAHEGRLVEVRGQVVAVGENEAGPYMALLSDDVLLVVTVFKDRARPFTFDDYRVGDYIAVTGVAGQFDPVPPYTGSYQVFPRTAGDVRQAGLSPTVLRWGLVGVTLVLALVFGWVFALRKEVQRRVAQLGATEARYQHLFDHAGDAVFLNTPDGKIVEVNRVAQRALGYEADDLAGCRLRDLVAPGATVDVDAHFQSALDVGEALGDVELISRTGRRLPFEMHTHRVVLNGVPKLLSMGRDVTARREYEKGLIEAKREAIEMARLKSAFLANMSHEIRTPLTAIIGFAEVLRDEVGPEHREFAATIEHGGKRLLGTLNSVLDLARLDAGREQLHPEVVDVVKEVRQALTLFARLAKEKDLALGFFANVPTLPASLDPSALDRVLTNLVGNAIKFTDRGGVRVCLETHGDRFRLTVQDTGIGIEPEVLPSLFTEFKQASEGLARTHEGTGLGLAITKRLVSLMGGEIRVESIPGVGSMFIVELPIMVGAAAGGDGAVAPVPAEAPQMVAEN
ncbi:MAG TPA: PAS domain-containing sensor histidine kinase [Rubricoccaceae bacterium]|nr:PAS domain-containing sensor histidine kinase [Rubricoccaceae bacterium]